MPDGGPQPSERLGSRLRPVCAAIASLLLAAAAPTSLGVGGLVAHPQTLSLDQLKGFPVHHVDADFATRHGQDHHSWTGALLWDVVAKAQPQDDPAGHKSPRRVVMVIGQDGYAAAFGIGEIDPSLAGKQVLLAYRRDDAPQDLPSLRLIVPGDRQGARDVHDVATLDIR